jgi:hypothetical protein
MIDEEEEKSYESSSQVSSSYRGDSTSGEDLFRLNDGIIWDTSSEEEISLELIDPDQCRSSSPEGEEMFPPSPTRGSVTSSNLSEILYGQIWESDDSDESSRYQGSSKENSSSDGSSDATKG